MDEKLWDELSYRWNHLFLNNETKLKFSEWMYYQGADAQAEAFKLAIDELNRAHFDELALYVSPVKFSELRAALAAAAIKEKA